MVHSDAQLSISRTREIIAPVADSWNAPRREPAVDPLEYMKSVFIQAVKSARPGLTNRQMALLMTVYLNPLPHTVRGLSAGLLLSKPVVSRALQQLQNLGLVDRQKDRSDQRNIFIERTRRGAAFLLAFSEIA